MVLQLGAFSCMKWDFSLKCDLESLVKHEISSVFQAGEILA